MKHMVNIITRRLKDSQYPNLLTLAPIHFLLIKLLKTSMGQTTTLPIDSSHSQPKALP